VVASSISKKHKGRAIACDALVRQKIVEDRATDSNAAGLAYGINYADGVSARRRDGSRVDQICQQ